MTISTPTRALALAALLAAALPASASAAKPQADLALKALSNPPASAQPGGKFTVSDTTRNGGRAKSKASTTAYYLSLDKKKSKSDVRIGTRKVRALRARRSSKASVKLAIPALVQPGTYRLLACADSAGRLRERSERNNCRAAARSIAIAVPSTTGGGTGSTGGTGGSTDPAPVLATLSIADASVAEGQSGTATASFTVSLNRADAAPVTVQFATADGAASAPADYTAQSGTLTFAPGETAKTVSVAVPADARIEPDEDYFVNLSAPVNATIADGHAVGTIGNDDVPATVRLTEFNPSLPSSNDLMELQVMTAGSLDGIVVQRNPGAAGTVAVATLPAVNVAANDYVVIHFNDSSGALELTSKTECSAPACYSSAWDVPSASTLSMTDSVYAAIGFSGTMQDAVPFEVDATTATAAFYTSLQAIQSNGLWSPADCGGAPCTGTSTPTGEQVSAELDGVSGTTVTGNSAQRVLEPGRQRGDWQIYSSSWGQPSN